ncbi:lipoprotein [Yersinia enterocolitica]|uniref:Lipoprotein n=2 Tax=Yersinia enterocolitica TaxID=630 RepID=A0A9P1PSZ5_YEREN|nr:lipoprotein [Yersinia enterocolitica]CNB66256.1 lipoprotein [Yersinia enterocolitica]CNE92823.1 lipoprotein [Yersinia enterocolitica]CNF09185.1 lipoprotein [Yersinia enterocolitica]CNF46746.1 lipoprotein [Yersinia enterocolitica]
MGSVMAHFFCEYEIFCEYEEPIESMSTLIHRWHSLMRIIILGAGIMLLSGCGSIISRIVPGQGHGHQYYPGVQWDMRAGPWKYVTVIDVPLSMIVDTFMLPIDAHHGPYE